MVSTQRLVRREFLRFGKRSGEQEEERLGMESEPNFEGLPEGKVHIFREGHKILRNLHLTKIAVL